VRTMKAIRKILPAGGRDATRLEEVPVPEPGPGEVLLKVLATAPCGTDRHIYNWDGSVTHIVKPPRTYGHEFCGEVAEIGPGPGAATSSAATTCRPRCTSCATSAAPAGRQEARLRADPDPGAARRRLLRRVRRGAGLQRHQARPQGHPAAHRRLPRRARQRLPHTEYAPLEGASVAVLGYGPIARWPRPSPSTTAPRALHLDVNPRSIQRARRGRRPATSATWRSSRSPRARPGARVVERNGGGVDMVFEMSGAEAAVNQAWP